MRDNEADITPPFSAEGASATGSIDVSLDNFMEVVIEASQNRFVLLDFWAPWCEPCKQLTPLLEKIVQENSDRLSLAKMDIEAHPEIAQQMQVQSIPAVFLFHKGQPIDGFMGAQSESDIYAFLERHMGDAAPKAAATQDIATAQAALAEGDIETAMQIFAQAVQSDPQNETALAGLAECYLKSDNLVQARALMDMVPDSTASDIIRLRDMIALAEKVQTQFNNEETNNAGGANDNLAALESALAADENAHQIRYDLALAYYAAQHYGEAIDALLEIITRAPKWQNEAGEDDAARKQLLEIFNAIGHTDTLVQEGRRRLSSLLFS